VSEFVIARMPPRVGSEQRDCTFEWSALADDVQTFTQAAASTPVLALCAYIAYTLCMQYTIRKVPNALDAALRRRAREQGKSLNEVAIEALARGAGVSGERGRQRDLRDIAGTWRSDRAFDRARAAQDTIDKKLWQ
jgi:hypothetical protein